MTFATGVLHWAPETFWNATFYELSCAYIGHCKANGLGFFAANAAGMTRDMIDQLKADTDRLKKENPDVPRKELKRLKGAQP